MSGPAPVLRQLWACFAYATVSISLTMFNKAVFAIYEFRYPSTLTTAQIVISLLFLLVWRTFGGGAKQRFDLKVLPKIFPMSFCWWIYVISGVTALRYLNVPMYSVFRRSTTMVVVIGEVALFKKRPSNRALFFLVTMCAGAIIAGATDLTYSLPGYIMVGICIVSTAGYLLLIRLTKDKIGLHETSLLFYNNLISLPLMGLYLVGGTNELEGVLQYPRLYDRGFQLFFLISATQAFVLNLCIFYATTINSPLATSVTGQLKDILTTSLGLFIFGDVTLSKFNLLGLAVGLCGGIGYAVNGYQEKFRVEKGAILKQ